jgi:hypothetical protein
MKPLRLHREFAAPWPAVLVEMKDFVDLARLAAGGAYSAMRVSVAIAKTVPAEALDSSPLSPFGQFRAILAALPRCRVEYTAAEHPAHRVDIEMQR